MLRKLTLLSIATALVMLVSLAAAPSAWATDLDVEIRIVWIGQAPPYNIMGGVQLLNSSGEPLSEQVWVLWPDINNEVFSTTIQNVPSQAAGVRFMWWDGGGAYRFWIGQNEVFSPQDRTINWGGTVLEMSASANGR
ncbi:MAG: hypothetical protein FJY67_03675 [Calditrichaeota bacterium]|nr:hypothetical protein [Calditrichota bacterium]